MQGVPSLETLCRTARAQGADILALTDTNGLYGAIRFLEVARASGIKPILGTELTYRTHRAVLLAKTPAGYGNLCRILSARHDEPAFDFTATVAQHRGGLIILSDDQAALTEWHRYSRDDLFVELTPGPDMAETLAFSRRSGLPPVATNRAQFVAPSDYQLHRLLRAIAMNTTLSRLPGDACCRPTHWMMPAADLARQFPHVPEALANSRHIAEHCATDWTLNTVSSRRFDTSPRLRPSTASAHRLTKARTSGTEHSPLQSLRASSMNSPSFATRDMRSIF